MHHRSKGLLLAAAAAASIAAAALSPTNAWAAVGCLDTPTGAAPNGRHWYYRIDRVNHQKCWFLGLKGATAQNVPLQRSSGLATQGRLAERMTATDCIVAPAGTIPGKHWYYRTDQATGRRCWRLIDRVSKIGTATTQLPAPAKLADSGTKELSKMLPRSTADAWASVQDTVDKPNDTVNEPTMRNNSERSPAQVAEVSYEELLRSAFGSRWTDSLDAARLDDREPSLADGLMRRPTAPAADRFRRTVAHVSVNGPSSESILAAFLVSLGGALIFLALLFRPFSLEGSPSVTRAFPAPFSLPSLESATLVAREKEYLELDAGTERDRYGIPFITRAGRRNLFRGSGPDKSARDQFSRNNSRAPALADVARGSLPLLETERSQS